MGRFAGQKFDCHEPLTYPYGCAKTSLSQGLIVLAWTLSLLTVSSCYFLDARPIAEPNSPARIFLGYGFLTSEGGGDDQLIMFGRCGKYTDFEEDQHIDGAWKAATAFAILPLLMGGVNALVLLTTCCLVFHDDRIFYKMYMVNIGCFVLQVLVFVGYANSKLCGGEKSQEYICVWGSGSGLNLGAAICWLLVAFLLYTWPTPNVEREYEEPSPVLGKKARYPMLAAAPPKKAPAPEYPKLTNGSPPRHKQITNGIKKQKPNTKQLTTGESSQPATKNNLRITNDPKKERPISRDQWEKSPKNNR